MGACALCLCISLAWLAKWTPFGEDEDVGRGVQLIRNLMSLLKSSPWLAVALPATSWWMSPAFGETTPLELAIVPLQIHGALLYGMGGWSMMWAGVAAHRRVSHWLPLLEQEDYATWTGAKGRWTQNALPSLWPLLLGAIRRDRKDAATDVLCGAADVLFGIAFGGMALWSLHAISFDQLMWCALLMQVSFVPYLVLVARDTCRSFARAALCSRVAQRTQGEEKWSSSLEEPMEELCFESVESLELMANVSLAGPLWPWRHTECLDADNQTLLHARLEEAQMIAAAGPETLSADDGLVEALLEDTVEALELACTLDRRTFNQNGMLSVDNATLSAAERQAYWAGLDGLLRTCVFNTAACWLYWFDLFYWAPFAEMLGASAAQLAETASLGLPPALLLSGCEKAGCVATSWGDVAWALEPGLYFALTPVRDRYLGAGGSQKKLQ